MTRQDDLTMTALLSQRRWDEPCVPNPPLAEMAAWDPDEDDKDAGWAFDEADRRGLLTLGLVGVVALLLILATGVLNYLSV